MFERLARVVTRRPRPILLVAAALVAVGGLYGYDAANVLSPGGYEVTNAESTITDDELAERFGAGPADIVLLVSADRPVESPEVAAEGERIAAALAARPDVGEVVSWWSTAAPQLRSTDGLRALIVARALGPGDAEVYRAAEAVRQEFRGDHGPVSVLVGGIATVNLEIVEESQTDLIRAELIAIPITTLILLFVFRSVVAALLPLVVSAVAVVGTQVVLEALSGVTVVSIFGLNLTTALGLGMAVDYSLFMISRWREERAGGLAPTAAVVETMGTAGRAVAFSGFTTAATLAALLVFDYPFLRSLAFAGLGVVLLAVVGAIVVLPAAMTVLGDRIDRWALRPTRPRPVEEGGWYRSAQMVMRRPIRAGLLGVAFLLLLGLPFLGARFGIPDDRVLPTSADSREVADVVRAEFSANEFGSISVYGDQAIDPVAAAAFARSLSLLDDVARVDGGSGSYSGGQLVVDPDDTSTRFVADAGRWWNVVPAVEPISGAAEDLVAAIRAMDAPVPVRVGGEPARLVDNKAEVGAKLPVLVLWVAIAILVLLYATFRSVVMPVKAFVLNLLSLTATYGAIVWIFQDGHLSGLLGFTPTGLTDTQTPVLMFCIAFGLSMDYEVFLLSRIREEWDRTGDSAHSVAAGLQRTGGLITAAAVLMAVVFFSFATGRLLFIQMVGVGLALAVLVDAIVVRAVLVPAFMALAGRWNWWSPFDRRSTQPVPNDVLTPNVAPPVQLYLDRREKEVRS